MSHSGGWRVDNRGLWHFYSFSLGFLAVEKTQPVINRQTMAVMCALQAWAAARLPSGEPEVLSALGVSRLSVSCSGALPGSRTRLF